MQQYTNTVPKGNARIPWIDTAKGIGIVLVILGHTYSIPHWIYCLIYGFHMPLFFLLSGLTYRYDPNIPFSSYVRKLSKSYLLPYITLSIANLVLQSLWLVYLRQFDLHILGKYLVGTLYCYATMEWMPNCSPLWFLCAIFLTKLVLFLFYRLFCSNKIWITCAVSLCGIIAWLGDVLSFPRLPWNLLPALMGCVFFWVGHLLREHESFLERGWSKITLFPIGAALLLSPWLSGNVPGMNENFYNNILLFLISGFGFSFLLIFLTAKFGNIPFLSGFLGKNTLILMGFNYFARTFAVEFYYLIPCVRNYTIRPLVAFILTFLLLLFITWLYVRFIQRRRKKPYAA